MHPLQGRPGANRKGLRLDFLAVSLFLLAGAGGCAGPLAFEFGSASIGTHADGTLRHPVTLPFEGDGYMIPSPWRARRANYATEELVGAVVRASRQVARSDPGGVACQPRLTSRAGGAYTASRRGDEAGAQRERAA